MRGVEHNGHETLTRLEQVLRLHGDFRQRLAPLRVTLLQAGVLLYLDRQGAAKLKDVAAALRVTPPTVSNVVDDLVKKRWVTRARVETDGRALRLRLSQKGERLARAITMRLHEETLAPGP